MNEYVFMVQARGIQIRENVKNIGAQVLEQVVRGAYSINGTGKNMNEHDYTNTLGIHRVICTKMIQHSAPFCRMTGK